MEDEYVKLNVGGVKFRTFKTTLQGATFFLNMFDQKKHTLNEKEEMFIDRDGVLFEHILDFLRVGDITSISEDLHLLHQLLEESKYYGIPTLEKEIEKILRVSRETKYEFLDLEDFKNRVCGSLQKRTYSSRSGYYEVLQAFNYITERWQCPRDISIHESSKDCGAQCRNEYDPLLHGWKKVKVTYLLVNYK
ncbi:hypothetical protein G6F56_007647 [Rhizopus delemar]|nr:hypothetical protein G6F56_007647 [Rhizopus delemar]